MEAIVNVMEEVRSANKGPLRKRKHAVMVAIDVRNAFNTLPERAVMEAVRRRLPRPPGWRR